MEEGLRPDEQDINFTAGKDNSRELAESFDTESDAERKEQITRIVFEMVQDSHGIPRKGEEEASWEASRSVAKRIERALEVEEIQVPYKLLTKMRELFTQILQKTKFNVSITSDSLDIIADSLEGHFDQLSFAEHDAHPYLEKMMRKAFGNKFDSRILEMMQAAGITEAGQIIEAFANIQKYYEVYRRVLNSKENFGPREGDETPIADLSSQPISEILENFTVEELAGQPFRAEDALRIIGEVESGFPISWSKCTPIEQGIIRKFMDVAVVGKPGAIVVDSLDGPIITAQEYEN